jgi:hypothetical protein
MKGTGDLNVAESLEFARMMIRLWSYVNSICIAESEKLPNLNGYIYIIFIHTLEQFIYRHRTSDSRRMIRMSARSSSRMNLAEIHRDSTYLEDGTDRRERACAEHAKIKTGRIAAERDRARIRLAVTLIRILAVSSVAGIER